MLALKVTGEWPLNKVSIMDTAQHQPFQRKQENSFKGENGSKKLLSTWNHFLATFFWFVSQIFVKGKRAVLLKIGLMRIDGKIHVVI